MDAKQTVDQAGVPHNNQLFAVFDDETSAASAEQALRAQGLQPTWLQGPDAAEALRRDDGKGGLLGMIERGLKSVGGESLEAERYAIHLDHGRIILALPCPDRNTSDSLTRILTKHGAYDVTFFGAWTIEHMSLDENAAHGLPTYESSTLPDELLSGNVPPHQPER